MNLTFTGFFVNDTSYFKFTMHYRNIKGRKLPEMVPYIAGTSIKSHQHIGIARGEPGGPAPPQSKYH